MRVRKDCGSRVQYDIDVNGRVRQVTVEPRDGAFVVTLDERTWTVDAAQVGTHTLSLLMSVQAGADSTAIVSREVSVATDALSGGHIFGVGTVPLPVQLNPRRAFGRRGDSADAGSGPQRIVAPMPGKVVRVLGAKGAAVAQRQAVVVIEAMKMENELRASRDGTITDVFVQEGQSVEAGTLLAIITPD